MNIVLVGIGGYGQNYVKAFMESDNKEHRIAGIVDPKPENCIYVNWLKDMNIPMYRTLEEFYAHSTADLAVIASPIHYHKIQACLALSKGSHVLCEKPISATVSEAQEMIEARNKSNRQLAIGYQWSYSEAIHKLKQDIMSGAFGKAKRLKTVVLWSRDLQYFGRAAWAGKKYDNNGNAIFDSVVNNATAHYLHNMFYVLGDTMDTSDQPVEVTSELYRANSIENFDTAAIRAITKKGAEILFYASHPVEESYGPVFEYEFEKGRILYGNNANTRSIVAEFQDGTIKDYGDPNEDPTRKLWVVIEALKKNEALACGPEAALSHTMCIDAIQKANILNFPAELIKVREGDNNSKLIYVEGLKHDLKECYSKNKLPGEAGFRFN